MNGNRLNLVSNAVLRLIETALRGRDLGSRARAAGGATVPRVALLRDALNEPEVTQ
jgi:hypothetical protein